MTDEVSLRHILATLGVEMSALGGVAEALQTVLSNAYALQGRSPDVLQQLQSCDLLTQKLDEIARFLRAIAAAVPADLSIDAAGPLLDIRLSALATALSLAPRETSVTGAGEVYLF